MMETKKNEKYDLERKRSLFFGIGLILSLVLVISAFEWRTEIEPICIFCEEEEIEEWTYVELSPVTKQEKLEPPKPKIKNKPKQSIDATEELEQTIKAIIDEPTDEPVPSDGVVGHLPLDLPVEIADEPIRNTAEVMPSPYGGYEAFYKFVGENIKYPSRAKKAGAEGKVFVQFIVEKDGSLSDIKVIRGVGFGCDEETLRVMKKIEKFKPGKQGDIRVRVRMVIPVNFQLK